MPPSEDFAFCTAEVSRFSLGRGLMASLMRLSMTSR